MLPTSNSKNNDSPKSTTNEAPASSDNILLRAAHGSLVLNIFAALLIPPLGLILAIAVGTMSKSPKKLLLTITLLSAFVIGTIGYVTVFTGLINISPYSQAKYHYQNANNNEFSTVKAAGMSFSKPSEFSSTAKKTTSNYSTESFAHFSPRQYPLSFIFTFSYKDSHTNDEKYIKGVNDFMTGAVKNSYRTEYINAIKKQIFDSYPGYDAQLGEPQKFTNANIKKNAWSFDTDITSSNPTVQPMKGKIVYILGPGVIYYFSLMVTEDNWTPNMAAWQTVLGSLKLGT